MSYVVIERAVLGFDGINRAICREYDVYENEILLGTEDTLKDAVNLIKLIKELNTIKSKIVYEEV